MALITSSQHPELILEDRPLVDALTLAGVEPVPAVWDGDADWSTFAAALVRTPWDYTYRREQFLAWADRAAQVTRLFNAAPVLRWNSHKGYLLELESRGVPIVPTVLVRSDEPLDLAALARARGWDEVVVKPCVSAGARDTVRVRAASGQVAAEAVRARGDLLVQPYQPAVEGEGERSLIFFDGEFSHAARKHPMLVDAPDRSDPLRATAAQDELELAALALSRTRARLLYARVDMVRGSDGKPQLMELELIEPRLFFPLHEAAAEMLARKLLRSIS